MWTRAELKARAKANVSRYFWAAFAVSLIFMLFGGRNSAPNINFNLNSESGYEQSISGGEASEVLGEFGDVLENIPIGGDVGNRLLWKIFAGALIVIVVLNLIIGIFVLPALQIGKNRFYMESRLIGQSAGVGKIFWGFRNHYLNITLTMFLRGLFIILGTCLCVIPGIYLSYCYYMVPYILAENPDMQPMEALRLSKDMMDGHKWNTVVLEFSFFGWLLLGSLLCGVGIYFVMPYYEATLAELYAILRRPHMGILNGFGYPDYGPEGYDTGNFGSAGGYGFAGPAGGTEANYGENGAPEAGWYGTGRQDNSVWVDSEVRDSGTDNAGTPDWNAQNPNSQEPNPHVRNSQDRGSQVKRSEGGPGRGYYLNGVFHPYEEDDTEQK